MGTTAVPLPFTADEKALLVVHHPVSDPARAGGAMHQAIISPQDGKYIAVRPGAQGAMQLPKARYDELAGAPLDAEVPVVCGGHGRLSPVGGVRAARWRPG